jgi:hypothetical protein
VNIQYRIVSVNIVFASISVNYYEADIAPDGFTYSIDVPLDANNQPITGDALTAEIMARAPTWMFDRVAALKNSDMSALAALAPVQSADASAEQPSTTGTTPL